MSLRVDRDHSVVIVVVAVVSSTIPNSTGRCSRYRYNKGLERDFRMQEIYASVCVSVFAVPTAKLKLRLTEGLFNSWVGGLSLSVQI